MLFFSLALHHVEGTAKDPLCCEPMWSGLLCSYSSPSSCGGKWVLWPGACSSGEAHDICLWQWDLWECVLPWRSAWRETDMAISSTFLAKILQLVWGWEMVIKIPMADHIFHQIWLSYSWTTFKIKHLRILYLVCALILGVIFLGVMKYSYLAWKSTESFFSIKYISWTKEDSHYEMCIWSFLRNFTITFVRLVLTMSSGIFIGKYVH